LIVPDAALDDTHDEMTVIPSAARMAAASTGHRLSGAHSPASTGGVAARVSAAAVGVATAASAANAAVTAANLRNDMTEPRSTSGQAKWVKSGIQRSGSGLSGGQKPLPPRK
jgi:hypothetical protein